MVPLLSSAPLAQNEFDKTSRALTSFVSRLQSAPQAEWLLICRGSSEALSKKIARVGETTMASRATIPELPTTLKDHSGARGSSGVAWSIDMIESKLAMRGSILAVGIPAESTFGRARFRSHYKYRFRPVSPVIHERAAAEWRDCICT